MLACFLVYGLIALPMMCPVAISQESINATNVTIPCTKIEGFKNLKSYLEQQTSAISINVPPAPDSDIIFLSVSFVIISLQEINEHENTVTGE